MMGKWLEVACFCTSVFPNIPVFPRFSRNKNRATSPPESKPSLFSLEPKAGLWKLERTSYFHTIFDDLTFFRESDNFIFFRPINFQAG